MHTVNINSTQDLWAELWRMDLDEDKERVDEIYRQLAQRFEGLMDNDD